MTKDKTFSRKGSKIQSVSTNRLTESSHIKALLEAVCFLCVGWLVYLLACSPSELCFFVLLLLSCLAKTETLLVHVIVVLGRLVDHLEEDAEKRAEKT